MHEKKEYRVSYLRLKKMLLITKLFNGTQKEFREKGSFSKVM